MRTRCPACSTVFRIAPEQIKARQGKVRCGQCQHIFDALDALVAEPTASSGKTVKAAANRVAAKAAPPQQEEAELAPPVASDPPATATEPSAPEATNLPEADLSVTDAAAPALFLLPNLPPPPPIRRNWPWAIGLGLALACLAVQALLFFRVELAVLLPDSRPLLEALCAPFDYQVELPHKIDLLGIDVSDLHPDPAHPNKLLLTATLKNRAPFAQLYPHLELTLTDINDKPVVRKVITPDAYLPKEHPLADGFATNSELPIQLQLDPGTLAAVGYRLYLFYP